MKTYETITYRYGYFNVYGREEANKRKFEFPGELMVVKPLPIRKICMTYVNHVKALAKGNYEELLIVSPKILQYPVYDNYDNQENGYGWHMQCLGGDKYRRFLKDKKSRLYQDEHASSFGNRHAALMIRLFSLLRKFKKVQILTDANLVAFDDFLFDELLKLENVELRFTTALHEEVLFINGEHGLMASSIQGIGQGYFFLQHMDNAYVKGAYSFVKEIWDKDAVPYSTQSKEGWQEFTDFEIY